MTHIVLLIAALNSVSVNVHGSKAECLSIAEAMVDLASSEALNPQEKPVHIDEDISAIKEFKASCEKKSKKGKHCDI